jgi:hypothetical protein
VLQEASFTPGNRWHVVAALPISFSEPLTNESRVPGAYISPEANEVTSTSGSTEIQDLSTLPLFDLSELDVLTDSSYVFY